MNVLADVEENLFKVHVYDGERIFNEDKKLACGHSSQKYKAIYLFSKVTHTTPIYVCLPCYAELKLEGNRRNY